MQKKLLRVIMAMVFAGFISGMAAGPVATPAWAAGQAFDQDQQAPHDDAPQGDGHEHAGHH